MINKRNISILLILTILLAIILPIFLHDKTETPNQTINIIATIISSFASVLTLIIAILLFNKFGIETPLLEKNTSVVFAFIEELKKTRLFINGKNYGLMIRLHDSYHTSFEEYYGEKLIFSREYLDGLSKLFEISESPFMPKSIYQKVDQLKFYILSMDIKDEDLNNFATVTVLGQAIIDAKFGRFNHKDMTLFELLNIIDDIKSETVKWISKNSNYSPDLNL